MKTFMNTTIVIDRIKFNNETITYNTLGNPLTSGNKKLTWMNGREL